MPLARYRSRSMWHHYDPPQGWHAARTAALTLLALLGGAACGCAVGLYGILKGWTQ